LSEEQGKIAEIDELSQRLESYLSITSRDSLRVAKELYDNGYRKLPSNDRFEQLANLLGLWRRRLPGYELNSPIYLRLKLCIDQLESILTGKPMPKP